MPKNRVLGYRARERSRMILSTVTVGIMILVFSSLQVSLFGKMRPFGAVPDVMLCLVLGIAFFKGEYAGAITGISAGFVIEAIGGQGMTLLPLVYLLYGYVGGAYARAVYPKRFLPYLFYLFCGLILRAATTLLYACMTWETVNIPVILLYSVLPEMGGTAIAGCVLYAPIKLVCYLIDRKTRA